MLQYMKNRIEAIRNNKVLDFMTEYMKRRGAELEDMRNDPLQPLQETLQSLHYAKERKNMECSETKQTTYRFKKEDL